MYFSNGNFYMRKDDMKARIIFLLALPVLLLAVGCATNPISGESQLMLFSEEQDIELGKSYAPEVEKEMGGKIQNLTLQNYVNSVGLKIAAVSHKPYFDFHYTALEDDTVNAFALPGGYIYITRGMLEKLESEAQLAAVFGHETTHVVARHSSAQISREIGIEIALSAVSSKAPAGAMQVADVTRQIVGLGYSRSQEKQADLAGLDYTVKAGYDPHAMVQTMQMLEAEDKNGQVEFLSTHPSPENRVGYISQAIINRGYQNLKLKVGKEDYKKFVLDELKP
jgi:predicted Zn-dependent protease